MGVVLSGVSFFFSNLKTNRGAGGGEVGVGTVLKGPGENRYM